MSKSPQTTTLKPTDMKEGKHVCMSTRKIETKYGTSYVLKLACGAEFFSNQSLKDFIMVNAGKKFSFYNHGMKSFEKKDGTTVNYVKISDFELI